MPKTKTKPKTMLVRIHRPNKRLGYIAETYTLSGSGYPKFDYRRGWYEVDLATAMKLRRALNNPLDQGSKPVFEVVSPEEGKALDVAEKQQVAQATAPIPLPQKIHKPTRAEVREAAKSEEVEDADLDLSNEDNDEDWDALTSPDDGEDEDEPEVQETASADDLADLDSLVEPPKPVAKKVTKKRATKKTAKKKATKKARGK